MKSNQPRRYRITRGLASGALFAASLLCSSANVFAQWTNGTNINNTNTGNVGIGTVSPQSKLTVSSATGGTDALPALGASGGKFALLNNGGLYGLLQGVLINGNAFMQ